MIPLALLAAAAQITLPPRINPAKPSVEDLWWQRAAQETYRSPEELAAQGERERKQGLKLGLLVRGDPTQKDIALTFDDGPHPGKTERLLDILRDKKVTATFFVIGKMVEKAPDLTRQIVRDGHALGNHTFSHVMLTRIPVPYVDTEYRACNDIVFQTTGVRMRFCRPPGGDYDTDVASAARRQGLTTALWTDDPADFDNPGEKVLLSRTLDRISEGGILLMHDGVEQTISILPALIDGARARGYRFVSLGHLQAERLAWEKRTGN